MRLNDMPRERWTRTAEQLVEPLDGIARDPRCLQALNDLLAADTMPSAARERAIDRLMTLAQTHADEVWTIIAVLTGQTTTEAQAKEAGQLLGELRAGADASVLRLFALCNRYGAAEVLAALSAQQQGGMSALTAALADREQRRAERAYTAQLLWHIGRALYAAQGEAWTLPDWFAMFPERKPEECKTADEVVQQVLRQLKGGKDDG